MVILLLAWLSAPVQADPAARFLQAYKEFQEAERLERDGRLRDAMLRYSSVAAELEAIRRDDPSWQETVVNFRLRKTREGIDRLRAEVEAQPPPRAPAQDPLIKRGFDGDLPEPGVSTRPPAAAPSATPNDTTRRENESLKRQVQAYREKTAQLEAELGQSRGTASSARMEVEKTKAEFVAALSRLAQLETALRDTEAERDSLKSQAGQPLDEDRARLAERIVALEAENEALAEENMRVTEKLGRAAEHLESATQSTETLEEDRRKIAAERDDARARLEKVKSNEAELARLKAEREQLDAVHAREIQSLQKRLEKAESLAERLPVLEQENKDLRTRLAGIEKSVADANAQGVTPEALEALKRETAELKAALEEARRQLAVKDSNVKDLVKQLDEVSAEATRLRLAASADDEQKRVAEENELLKKIVLRQIRERIERSAQVADLEAELQTLNVQSESLVGHLAALRPDQGPLTAEEQKLFNAPVADMEDSATGGAEMSLTLFKPIAEPPPAGPDKDEIQGQLAKAGGMQKSGRTAEAEKLYFEILEKSPDDVEVLTSLGSLQSATGRPSAARVALEKALRLAPSHAPAVLALVAVDIRQQNPDAALVQVDGLLKQNDSNATAWNYAGIAHGLKNDPDKAAWCFEKTLSIDPGHASAHFNLARVKAFSKPPDLSAARRHYAEARRLGAAPDTGLEKVLSTSTKERASD